MATYTYKCRKFKNISKAPTTLTSNYCTVCEYSEQCSIVIEHTPKYVSKKEENKNDEKDGSNKGQT